MPGGPRVLIGICFRSYCEEHAPLPKANAKLRRRKPRQLAEMRIFEPRTVARAPLSVPEDGRPTARTDLNEAG